MPTFASKIKKVCIIIEGTWKNYNFLIVYHLFRLMKCLEAIKHT